MRVVEPGHIYDLHTLDGDGQPLRLVFVNREAGTEHPGTQTQEVLRTVIDLLACLIDRTNHCDACLRWEGNDRIIKALSEAQRQANLAILFHEQRVLERKFAKNELQPASFPLGEDGHFALDKSQEVSVAAVPDTDLAEMLAGWKRHLQNLREGKTIPAQLQKDTRLGLQHGAVTALCLCIEDMEKILSRRGSEE